jgi:hypothetical protein
VKGRFIRLTRFISAAVLLAGLASQATGCAPRAAVPLSASPDFTGWVTGIEPGIGKNSGRIVVESQTDKIVRRLIVTVPPGARIYRVENGKTRPVGFAGIALQDQAKLWLTGAVPTSFPADGTAVQVLVERLY